jgi:hypothetical protein
MFQGGNAVHASADIYSGTNPQKAFLSDVTGGVLK